MTAESNMEGSTEDSDSDSFHSFDSEEMFAAKEDNISGSLDHLPDPR